MLSQKEASCAFAPDRADVMREDYDGTITKYGLDLGVVGGGIMVWVVFTRWLRSISMAIAVL